MRSSTTAGKFGTFSALTLASAAVLVFHTAALAQQPEAKKDDATKEAAPSAKDAKAKKVPASAAKAKKAAAPESEAKTEPTPEPEVKAAPTAEAEAKVPATPQAEAKPSQTPQELPPEYSPPPGYRHGPPPPPPPPPSRYPQPPSEDYGPYYHDYYYGAPPPPYPPPRYYRRYAPPPPPPVRYYPEPLRYRSFFFGFGLGVGGLAVFPDQAEASNASRAGLGYSFRFGFGVSPRWSLVLAADGASAYFDNVTVAETVFTVGPQVFITRNLYARAGIGAAGRTYDRGDHYYDDNGNYYDDSESESGMGAAAAVGFEFMQSYHVALALEAVGTVGFYPNHDVLSTFGVNFVLNLF